MALVRILVDGFSLLHAWPEVAPRQPRHSAAARDELVHWLTQYQDAIGTPMTVIFDGTNAPSGTPKIPSRPEMEILYSPAGRTADDLIERATHRLLDFGDVLVVTDDNAERSTVLSLGGMTSGCTVFIDDLKSALGEIRLDLEHLNRRERHQFKRPR